MAIKTNKYWPIYYIVLLCVSLLASACHTKDAADVATVQFYPRMWAVATDTGVAFEVTYYDGDDVTDPQLLLDAQDKVIVSTNGSMDLEPIQSDLFSNLEMATRSGLPPTRIELERESSVYFLDETDPVYRGSIFGEVQNVTFDITLDRKSLLDAPNSRITLPQAVTMVSPLPNSTFSWAGDEIVLEWIPSGVEADQMEIELDCECPGADPDRYRQTVPDPQGMHGIDLASLFAGLNLTTENCACAVEICRTRQGVLSNVFVLGGVLIGKQPHQFSIVATP